MLLLSVHQTQVLRDLGIQSGQFRQSGVEGFNPVELKFRQIARVLQLPGTLGQAFGIEQAFQRIVLAVDIGVPEQSGQNLFLLALAGQQFAGLLLQALLLGAGGSQSLSLLCQSLLRIRKRQLGFSECAFLFGFASRGLLQPGLNVSNGCRDFG